MKHATASALDALEPLLVRLRALPGMTEKKRGIFYRRSVSFLHFHEDPAGLFADVREPDGDYSRMQIDTLQQQDALMLAVGKLLGVV
jgi:hypothetical protein